MQGNDMRTLIYERDQFLSPLGIQRGPQERKSARCSTEPDRQPSTQEDVEQKSGKRVLYNTNNSVRAVQQEPPKGIILESGRVSSLTY